VHFSAALDTSAESQHRHEDRESDEQAQPKDEERSTSQDDRGHTVPCPSAIVLAAAGRDFGVFVNAFEFSTAPRARRCAFDLFLHAREPVNASLFFKPMCLWLRIADSIPSTTCTG
jgi:hypothetical protein